jgi:hypothetical protein
MRAATQGDLKLEDLIQADGTVALDEVARMLQMTKPDLATVLGISQVALSKSVRLAAAPIQHSLTDLGEILIRVTPWAGSVPQAFAWFCAQPLPSFGDQTCADLVREGRADAAKS